MIIRGRLSLCIGHVEERLVLVELHAPAPPLLVLRLLPRHDVLGELIGRWLTDGHCHVYCVVLQQHLEYV